MKKEIIKDIDFEKLTPESISEMIKKYNHESPPYKIILEDDEIYAMKMVNSYNIHTGMTHVHVIDINGKYLMIKELSIILIEYNDSIEEVCNIFNDLMNEAEIFYNQQNNIVKNDDDDRDVI